MPPSRPRVPWYIRVQRAPGRLLKWLADLGAKLVSPIEWAIASLARGGLAVTEGFEGLESIGLRIGRALVWPFRMLWAMVVRLAAVVVPKSLRKMLAAPFHGLAALGQWFGHALMRAAEALNLDGVILRLVKWTRWIWYPFAAIGGFLQAWLATRDYRQLLWGVPVVVILLPILGAVTWTKLWGKGGIASQYRLAVKEALEQKDFERVQLYERKLAQLGVDSRMTDFKTADALAHDGKLAEAYERMQLLAPIDSPGYPAAHYWIIQQLLDSKLDVPKEEGLRLIGIHLEHLQTLGVRGPQIELLEAFWLVRGGRTDEAIEKLALLVNRLPLAAVLRMDMNIGLGRHEDARGDARAVRAHMQDRNRRGLNLNAQDYRSWYIAERLLGNADRAESNVRAWLKLEPENLETQRALAELCQIRFASLIATSDPDPEELAGLFIEAAELTDNPHLLQRWVGQLYRQRDRIPVAEHVIELVARSPRTQAAILEAAGTAAAAEGNLGQAKAYLEQAVEKDPSNSIAWNNYGYILTQLPNPDVPKALAAVNKALALTPNEFHFRETRGQILVLMGKWQEAIPDLEYAVNGMPTSREIHQALATAYEGVGEEQLARIHRQQAQ